MLFTEAGVLNACVTRRLNCREGGTACRTLGVAVIVAVDLAGKGMEAGFDLGQPGRCLLRLFKPRLDGSQALVEVALTP